VKYVYKFFMFLERLRYHVYISCNITNIIAVGYEELINLDQKIIKATLCGIECRRLCSDCKQPHTTHYIVNLSITLTQHIHLVILISACWTVNLFSFFAGHVSLPCNAHNFCILSV